MSRRTASAGFTLIEMMVVMVIIGLLMALVGPRFIRQEEKAKVKAARAQIELLGTALDTFRLDVGRYPSTQEGLTSLRHRPFRAARQRAATMHYCRGEAVAPGKPHELVIDAVQNTVRTSGGRSGALSERAVIERVEGGFEPAQGVSQILFYPNGSTTGADVVVASRRDRAQGGRNRLLVHLDPLVCTVAVRDAAP